MTQAFVVNAPAVGAAASPLLRSPLRYSLCAKKPLTRNSRVAPRRAVIVGLAAPVPVDVTTFEEEVIKSSAEQPVLVYFGAVWCGPCKLMSPLMDWAASEYDGRLKVAKIEVDENPALIKRYDVQGLPTMAVVKNGDLVGVTEGAMNQKTIAEYVKKHTGI